LKEFCWIEKAEEIFTNLERLEGVLLAADCRRLEEYPQT
jgi:hypothetical protein